MLYDLHVHTAEYSACSAIPADELCRIAVALGIDGIALTEHDLWWPKQALASLRARHPDLLIYNGMERSCREGHFLVFLPDSPDGSRTEPPDTVYELLPWTHARNGMLIWAHPFRYGKPTRPHWLGQLPLDGIEIESSNMDIGMSELADRTADDYHLVRLTNSDAHSADSLGRYFNQFGAELRTISQLIGYLKMNAGTF